MEGKIELHIYIHTKDMKLDTMTMDRRMRMYEKTLSPAIEEWIGKGIFKPSARRNVK